MLGRGLSSKMQTLTETSRQHLLGQRYCSLSQCHNLEQFSWTSLVGDGSFVYSQATELPHSRKKSNSERIEQIPQPPIWVLVFDYTENQDWKWFHTSSMLNHFGNVDLKSCQILEQRVQEKWLRSMCCSNARPQSLDVIRNGYTWHI